MRKLSFSAEQVKSITECINRPQTWIVLLEGALKRARGDADKFFAVLDASAWGSPDEDDRRALNKFFANNAKALGELSFSAEQAKGITKYINKPETWIVLLEGALKRAGRGNADIFFTTFKATAWGSPEDSERDALSKFFVGNAKAIMDLGLSLDQIEFIDDYIDRHSTSIKILELALERAEHASDFFNVFHTIVPDSPSARAKQVYGNFLIDHARLIVDLVPSVEQWRMIRHYGLSPSEIYEMGKNQKRKKKRKKAKKDCTNNVAALLGPFKE